MHHQRQAQQLLGGGEVMADGGDASTVEAARGQWRAVTAAGLAGLWTQWRRASGR